MTARLAVVDDDRSFTELLQTMLGTRGYAVDVYHSGSALLEALRAGATPNVVLLDVLMPDLDGIETLRAIRLAHSAAQVIMLSGRQAPATIVEAVRLGAADYVLKPGDPEGVGEAARRHEEGAIPAPLEQRVRRDGRTHADRIDRDARSAVPGEDRANGVRRGIAVAPRVLREQLLREQGAVGASDKTFDVQGCRGHAERGEQVPLDHFLVAHAANPGDHLARRIIGDVLIAPASARRADAVQRRKRAAQEGHVLPFLELVVERVAIKPKAVAQHVPDGCLQFVTSGEMQ